MTFSTASTNARSSEDIEQPSLLLRRTFEPLTRAVFAEAGIHPGMHILDVYSGTGDLAFLARKMVGPAGHVTGFDVSAEAVAYANDRAKLGKFTNVNFVHSDISNLPRDEFDGLVGRAVLMYRRNPARDLRALLRCVRPGGIVVFQELDLLTAKAVPLVPLIEDIRRWLLTNFTRAGVELEMGPKLYSVFKAAGLGPPKMRADAFVGGVESSLPAILTDTIGMLMHHFGMPESSNGKDIDIYTLEERLRADLTRTSAVIALPLLIGAWVRLPG